MNSILRQDTCIKTKGDKVYTNLMKSNLQVGQCSQAKPANTNSVPIKLANYL